MIAAFHNSYVDFVIYMGMTEDYPTWFEEEVLVSVYMDEHRYTFYIPLEERTSDYYEKTLVEDYSVFLRKTTGEIFCTTYDAFMELYDIFTYNGFSNSGIAAFSEDCITYVECEPGVLSAEYPDWFYEFFTEAIHFPPGNESIFIFDMDNSSIPISTSDKDSDVISPLDTSMGQVSIDHHCVFLRNHLGEIRHMRYETFLKYYNPGPLGGHYYEY